MEKYGKLSLDYHQIFTISVSCCCDRYVGHGSGGRYFHGDDIEKLQGRAAIILMGCSSGKLSVKGQLEPSGMMISYFLAGWYVSQRNIQEGSDVLMLSAIPSHAIGISLWKKALRQTTNCLFKHLLSDKLIYIGPNESIYMINRMWHQNNFIVSCIFSPRPIVGFQQAPGSILVLGW